MRTSLCFVTALAIGTALAFDPPEKVHGGIGVSIPDFETSVGTNRLNGWRFCKCREVCAKGAPLAFRVVVSNGWDRTCRGKLTVYLNDDWEVSGPTGEVDVAAGEMRSFGFTAIARPRTVNALYPIHAEFTPDGAAKSIHPIAIFRTAAAAGGSASAALEKDAPHRAQDPNPEARTVDDGSLRLAAELARTALTQGTDSARGRYLLADGDSRFGAGVVRGKRDLADGAIAFADRERTLVYRGFQVEVDGEDVVGREVATPFATEVSADRGALKIRWKMPGVIRSKDGHPRFTRINLRGCTEKVERAYFGFGNVVERPGTFTVSAGGTSHNTRHIGADYGNGLSLVQATDTIQQKPLISNRELNLFSTVTGNDATFFLVPGAKGAFEAARRFRRVAGYRRGPGFAALSSRVCLDRWFCYDYEKITEDVKTLVRYGVTDCVFVKHDWRRWAWDFADPDNDETLPGKGSHAACVKTCQAAGMLYVPHDNYIDYYPTNPHYSYDDIVFNLDGSPQVAYYVPGRNILSYRWNPSRPFACAKRNMEIIRKSYAPDGIFLDVFTAHCPTDYLDRDGTFHTREEMSAWWGKTHRACLDWLGKPTGPAISEAGQDHLIGVIDGAQSDHFDAYRIVHPGTAFADAELVPWHDMVSHGYFILYGGGLEYRYAARAGFSKKVDVKNHGYGTDDYLSNTVIGGRTPIALGAPNERTVHTYWMLHDLCAVLAQAELVSHEFCGSIHRQHTIFSNGAEVWTNRGSNEVWTVGGLVLPRYGFLAKAPGGIAAAVIERNGERIRFSHSPGVHYLDATGCKGPVTVGALTTARAARLECPRNAAVWKLTPVRRYQSPFSVHIDLARLGASSMTVKSVQSEVASDTPAWKRKGDELTIVVPANAFDCIIQFSR